MTERDKNSILSGHTMPTSRKKVIVRTVGDELQAGYLPLSHLLTPAGANQPCVDLLDLSGRLTPVPLAGVQWIAFVREFDLNNAVDPEQMSRRSFMARPRSEGLWVRLTFLHGEALEGLAPIDASLLDALLDDRGLFLTPPDMRGNTQRLYIPRLAIRSLEILAVITTPSKKQGKKPAEPTDQKLLFPDA